MNSFRTLKVSSEQQILTVTFNQPQRLNAITTDFMVELGALCDELSEDTDTRVVIFTGAGRGFCSGLDLSIFEEVGKSLDQSRIRELIRVWQGTFNRVEQLSQITIAAVNGVCLGAGVELILACDFRISSSRAMFALPEVKFGVIPDLGGVSRLTRMVGTAWAKEMILRARNVTAMEALRIGLVNRVSDPGDMLGIARNWATQFIKLPPEALAQAKRLINRAFDTELALALLEAEQVQLKLLAGDEFRSALEALREENPEAIIP